VRVAQGLADIDAMLVPGLSALATLTARGQDATTPALALWREFHAARGSVLAAL
jgi:putative intracellular protease/amidase